MNPKLALASRFALLGFALSGCALPSLAQQSSASAKPTPVSNQRDFVYGGTVFNRFVDDSFQCCKTPNPASFFKEMDAEFVKASKQTVAQWIASEKSIWEKSGKSAATTRQIGADLHKMIKKSIRKFSLDRGFEFANVVNTGERQCFLQSVLISGILQKIGMESGVAMVWKNIEGQPSNNGHAVCLLRLDPKNLIIVDASEPMPFPTHKGLFLLDKSTKQYAFVLPKFAADASFAEMKRNDSGKSLTPSGVDYLDIPFLDSQFDYYRGERAIGGILGKPSTPAGLASSLAFFQKAEKECANNPLVVAMLSRTYEKLGKSSEAKQAMARALPLYKRFGWVPKGIR